MSAVRCQLHYPGMPSGEPCDICDWYLVMDIAEQPHIFDLSDLAVAERRGAHALADLIREAQRQPCGTPETDRG